MTDTLILPPNMEKLVSDFLRDQDEVAALIADRVYTAIPKAATYPLVRVSLLESTPVSGSQPLWAELHYMQVEAFGGSKGDAWRIAATCRAALDQRLVGTYSEGVVNGVDSGGMIDQPDETFEPAKPRWLFTSTITAHPSATLPPS